VAYGARRDLTQLDRIEAQLAALCRHLGVEGASSAAPSPEDTAAIEKQAEEHKAYLENRAKELFREDGELTDKGKVVAELGWMDA